MITIKEKVDFRRRSPGRAAKKPVVDVPVGRIPRISKLMALAIRFDRLLREGTICGHTDLARLAKVTQPRRTQIMNLLHLAPDIQEELLFLPRVESGDDPIHEKMLWPIGAETDWGKQRGCGNCSGRIRRPIRGLAGLCSVFKRLTGKGLSG